MIVHWHVITTFFLLINFVQAVALKYGTDNNVADLKEPQNVLFYDMVGGYGSAAHVQLVEFIFISGVNCYSSFSGPIFIHSGQRVI